MTRLECFHACKTDGGLDHVISSAPFMASTERPQWLGPGYYFWYGDNELANWWAASSIKSHDGQAAIFEFELRVKKRKFLDLVGEPRHIKYFEELAQIYVRKQTTHNHKSYSDITVSELLHFLVEENDKKIFDFHAVKGATRATKDLVKFISGRNDHLGANRRQQICVFPSYDCVILRGKLINPKDWVVSARGKSLWINIKRVYKHLLHYSIR